MFYRRHLPDWQKSDNPPFITWRLCGSLRAQTMKRYLKENNHGKKFLLLDRELDKARYGPTWLKDARLAKIVVDSFCHGDEHLGLYQLSAYVVISNHVHILVRPTALLARITKSIKDTRHANIISC